MSMSDSKFTPGPWDRIAHREKDSMVGANTLLAVVYSTAYRDTENQKANAHLVSAAPDLYQFVQDTANSTNCICKLASLGGIDIECTHCRAMALLAKARGEA